MDFIVWSEAKDYICLWMLSVTRYPVIRTRHITEISCYVDKQDSDKQDKSVTSITWKFFWVFYFAPDSQRFLFSSNT